MSLNHLPFWLAALHLPGVGPRKFMRWLEYFPDIENLFSASNDELLAAGLSPTNIEAIKSPDWRSVEQDMKWAQSPENNFITLADDTYPPLLKEITDPPLVLYVRGDLTVLSQTQIAIVGARNATPTGLKNAEYFAYTLAQSGFVITSGLAAGIDGASHRGAVAAKMPTIAVCGTGLNHIYPRSHDTLAKEIITQNGALISEFPLQMPPHAANFPRRNRIIAGLSLGVLVVESSLKSGSLITARHALESDREVFAIPGSIHNPLARGCHHLIRQGAKLVEDVGDIIEELGGFSIASVKTHLSKNPYPLPSAKSLLPKHRQLLEQIDYEITPTDVIVLRSRLTASEVSSMLLVLELNGYIQSVPGGYVRQVFNQ